MKDKGMPGLQKAPDAAWSFDGLQRKPVDLPESKLRMDLSGMWHLDTSPYTLLKISALDGERITITFTLPNDEELVLTCDVVGRETRKR